MFRPSAFSYGIGIATIASFFSIGYRDRCLLSHFDNSSHSFPTTNDPPITLQIEPKRTSILLSSQPANIMKLYFIAAYTFSFLLPLAVSFLEITVLLNKGVLPTEEGYNCNETDSELIAKVLEDDDDYDRRLITKTATQCKRDCQGYVPGSCHIKGCQGYRRQLERERRTNRLSGKRKLVVDEKIVCAYGMEVVNKQLDDLLPHLSDSCRPVVQFQRELTCFDDVRYAQILGFNLWNADTDTIVATHFQNATRFCYTNSNLNIEAVANGCVDEVDMRLSGPVNEFEDTEDTAPYTVFGFQYSNRKNLYGKRLPIGTYTVTTELEDSFTPKNRVTFSVVRC